MNRADTLIADMVNALDAIRRADNLAFCQGVAEQAIANVRAQQVRNADGYFVMADDPSERFWVDFTRITPTAIESWAEDFATLTDAREAAETTVDDRQAQSAHLRARLARINEQYDRTGWTSFE